MKHSLAIATIDEALTTTRKELADANLAHENTLMLVDVAQRSVDFFTRLVGEYEAARGVLVEASE